MEIEPTAREFDLISLAASSAVLTTRDDQYGFPWLLDAAHVSRRRGGRFRLVDSGKNDIVSLIWLAEAGAHIFTSDEARPDPKEVIDVQRAGRKSGALTYYYIYGLLTGDSTGARFSADAVELGRSGADLHLSNRERPRETGLLLDLARACVYGRGRLVYYHFGRPEPFLENAAEAGAWIHWSNPGPAPEQHLFLLKDILAAGRKSGAGLILHVEDAWPVTLLNELRREGAFLHFHTPQSERASDRRTLELISARRAPDFRAFYLHADFLP